MVNTSRIKIIEEKLIAALEPTYLKVTDDSQQHIGHAGAELGMGHFTVAVASPKFEGQDLLACHQQVYKALGDLMKTDIHALRIEILDAGTVPNGTS